MLTAIVLAAGSSKRMGGENKLLLPYKSKTIIASVVENLIKAGIEEIIVVVGYEAEQIKNALKELPVNFIYNAAYANGITTSIQSGVLHAKGDGYMICLSDMVLITPEEYALLQHTFKTQVQLNKKCICVPRYKNEKGNPVIFSSFYREAILQHTDMNGCKTIVESNKENIYPVDMQTNHILSDIDYLEDYKKLSAGFKKYN